MRVLTLHELAKEWPDLKVRRAAVRMTFSFWPAMPCGYLREIREVFQRDEPDRRTYYVSLHRPGRQWGRGFIVNWKDMDNGLIPAVIWGASEDRATGEATPIQRLDSSWRKAKALLYESALTARKAAS